MCIIISPTWLEHGPSRRLTCTDVEECEGEGDEDDEQETRCERCQDAPQRLVCGCDGHTYHSRCIASGLRDVDVTVVTSTHVALANLPWLQYSYVVIDHHLQ